MAAAPSASPSTAPQTAAPPSAAPQPILAPSAAPPVARSLAPALSRRFAVRQPLLKAAVLLIAALTFWTAWQVRQDADLLYAAFRPTATPPTPSPTPTAWPTPSSTPTLVPTRAPTETPTPQPTPTLLPPVSYQIAAGEILLNIALRFNVSIESIVEINPGLSANSITAGQTILVPLPTATPPLVPVEVQVGGETAVADPTDCLMHEIVSADTYFGLAQRYNVTLEAILKVNRLTETNVPQPGDTVCIPKIVYSMAEAETGRLPGEAPPVVQPRLLYPAPEAAFDAGAPLILQWLGERDLAADEWYMVELTNLTAPESRPWRAFIRQTSFQLPENWLTPAVRAETYRWRISFVRLSGDPAGALRYAYNGPAAEAHFVLNAGE